MVLNLGMKLAIICKTNDYVNNLSETMLSHIIYSARTFLGKK